MSRLFQEHHLLQLLEDYNPAKGPFDSFMSLYFKMNKAIGSKDKAFISETAYTLLRWQGLLDTLSSNKEPSWLARYEIYSQTGLEASTLPANTPIFQKVSTPEFIWNLLVSSYGETKAEELCRVLNTAAPTTIRANLLKTTKDALLNRLEGKYQVCPCQMSPCGITFLQKAHFYSMDEFKEGLFEIQDEASQLIANLVQPLPHQKVLDYCAGAGGKALSIGATMQGVGQLYLHDTRPSALIEAKKRLKRASIQNSQIVLSDETTKLMRLKKKMDWVLVDVPCSGSGTFRRSPDMKWKIDEARMQALVGLQRSIFEKALSFVKPGGFIVYATCSIFADENEKQVAHFLKSYPLTLKEPLFQTLPKVGQMDGMFAATFQRM